MITSNTVVHIIEKKSGHASTSTLNGWFLSLTGGSRWEDYEITTDKAEAEATSVKYQKISKIVNDLSRLTPDAVSKIADDIMRVKGFRAAAGG